jgi:hypothetical protein
LFSVRKVERKFLAHLVDEGNVWRRLRGIRHIARGCWRSRNRTSPGLLPVSAELNCCRHTMNRSQNRRGWVHTLPR